MSDELARRRAQKQVGKIDDLDIAIAKYRDMVSVRDKMESNMFPDGLTESDDDVVTLTSSEDDMIIVEDDDDEIEVEE